MAKWALDHWNSNNLLGDSTDEEWLGGDGNDIIAGRGGDDFLRGQRDNDTLFGELGEDVLWGGDDNDILYGGSDRDELDGGEGNDSLFFGGEDIYDGGSGTDTFYAGSTPFYVLVNGSISTVLYDAASEGIRIDIENGVAVDRGTGAATENFYADGVLGPGLGDAEFNSIETYRLTDFGDYFAGDNTGDTIYGYDGNDVIEGRGGADDIYGGSGSDTVEYGSSGYDTGSGVNVDLERGTGFIGDAEGDTYSSIENIRGTSYLDALYGNDSANTILGREGNDFLEGRGGGDVLDGGEGVDLVMYTSSPNGVTVDLRLTTAQSGGDAQGDILRDVENLEGSPPPDVLTGNSGANQLYGAGSSDTIDGGFGNDVLIGGPGTDTVDFSSWNTGLATIFETIRIELGEGSGQATRTVSNPMTQVTSVVETDSLSGFENVRGSNRSETIVGNSGVNLLQGEGGNDVLQGNGGNDTLNGGPGTDTASYESNAGRVIVVLGANGAAGQALEFAAGGQALVSSDGLTDIENVRGSAFNDTIIGNQVANRIEGGAGPDTLTGGGEADTFVWRATGDTGVAVPAMDLITDFNRAQGDLIDVNLVDANVYANGNQAFTFIGANAFSGTPGEINYIHVGNETIIQMQTGTSPDIEGAIRISRHRDAGGELVRPVR